MRVADHIVSERRKKLAQLLATRRYLPVREICENFHISEATARRDLAALVKDRVVKRTYGGAVTEFDERFPSFSERELSGREGKQTIASMAADLIKPRDTIYLDAGTTVAAIARKIADRQVSPLRIVSCSLPATEILASVVGVEVFLTAGQILTRQSALFGDFAVRSLEHWHFDHSFISCEGLDADGLWNTSPGIVALQRTVHERSRFLHVCIDSTKVGRKAAVQLFDWTEKFDILSDELPQNLRGFGYRSPNR